MMAIAAEDAPRCLNYMYNTNRIQTDAMGPDLETETDA